MLYAKSKQKETIALLMEIILTCFELCIIYNWRVMA